MIKIVIIRCSWLDDKTVESWLSENELRRCASFGSEKRRYQYSLGRVAAKIAIKRFLKIDINPKNIDIKSNENGAPIVDFAAVQSFGLNQAIGISISHSDEYAAVVAFESGELSCGIDIEAVNPEKIKALQYISLKGEPAVLDDPEQMTVAWCMKEALGKAIGTGLGESYEKLRIKSWKVENTGIVAAKYAHFQQYKVYARAINSERNGRKMIVAVTIASEENQDGF